MYLIDTMVLSERSKERPQQAVIEWMDTVKTEDGYISVVTVGEIERGIRKFELREGRPATRHRQWLELTLLSYGKRVLPVTTEISRRWGWLSHDLKHTNPDLLIAATALEHDLTVATRNVRHFEPTGLRLFNPYKA